LTPEACAQVTSESGVIDDDEGAPVAYPSRLLGTKLPNKVDLRSEMPPVADQGDLLSESCVAFATVYYQMTQYVKHFKHPEWDLKNPEHQFSVAFARNQSGQPSAPNVYASLMKFGCVDAAEMQYNQFSPPIQPTAAQLEAAKPYRIGGYAALWDYGMALPPYNPPNPIQNAKAWLADGYVLVISVDPSSPGWPGQSGVCTPPTPFFDTIDPTHHYAPGGHEVAICGYNDNINPKGKGPDHRGGFLMVNSEGLEWNGNMHGYIWLSYAYVKQYIPECWIMIMGGASDAPLITGCTPLLDTGTGYSVTISGTNFGSNRRSAGVTINGVRPTVYNTWTNESINLIVPYCVTSGPVVVYNWENTPSNSFPVP
jgi:hypothetical protein